MTTVLTDLPDADAAKLAADLADARQRVDALTSLLEEEFQALRAQAFDHLESLQPRKVEILEALSAFASEMNRLPQPPEEWLVLLDALRAGREAWRRNEQLVTRQLEVVQSALRSMQAADPAASIELYNRQGVASRRLGSRVFSDA